MDISNILLYYVYIPVWHPSSQNDMTTEVTINVKASCRSIVQSSSEY